MDRGPSADWYSRVPAVVVVLAPRKPTGISFQDIIRAVQSPSFVRTSRTIMKNFSMRLLGTAAAELV